MENPATHNNATVLIAQVIRKTEKQLADGVCGRSMEAQIASELEACGYLMPVAMEIPPVKYAMGVVYSKVPSSSTEET